MRRLIPTLRNKKRYVAFEIISDAPHDIQDAKKALWDSLLRLFGEVGSAKIDAHFVDEQCKGKKGIIRCAHTGTDELLSSMAFVSSISGKKAVFRSLGMSSTIKGTRKFL